MTLLATAKKAGIIGLTLFALWHAVLLAGLLSLVAHGLGVPLPFIHDAHVCPGAAL